MRDVALGRGLTKLAAAMRALHAIVGNRRDRQVQRCNVYSFLLRLGDHSIRLHGLAKRVAVPLPLGSGLFGLLLLRCLLGGSLRRVFVESILTHTHTHTITITIVGRPRIIEQ